MRFKWWLWGLSLGLIFTSFYTLRGESDMPDYVLESIHLLKKPIEELLPDLQDEDNALAIEETTLNLEPYQDLRNDRDRWNEMRRLIEAGQPLAGPLPSEIAVSTAPVGRLAPA